MAELEKNREVKRQDQGQGLVSERTKTGNVYLPNVDICEDKDGLTLYADVPGAGDGDIEITLENDVLTIKAKIVPEKADSRRLAYAEYGVGDFYRSFTLTEAVDRDRIEASIKDGVLRVVLPKAEAVKPKQIKIKTT